MQTLIIKIMKLVSLILMGKGYQVGRGRAVLMVQPPGSAEEADYSLAATPVISTTSVGTPPRDHFPASR